MVRLYGSLYGYYFFFLAYTKTFLYLGKRNYYIKKMKVGLVLEGGGMRGLYTAGVIDIMLDHGFEPDVVCGASAGVTFGINLISKL